MGKLQKYNKHHQQEPSGYPFRSRWPQGSNEQMRKQEKHKTQKNTNDPQKKYRLGMVSKSILLEGLNWFYCAILTLCSDVDQGT